MRQSPRSLLPALLLLTLTAGCASAPVAGNTGQGEPLPTDQSFLAAAAREGLAEVRYAELAEERSHNPEVKTFAHTVLDHYRTTNAALRQIAASKGIPLPEGLDKVQEWDLNALNRLYTFEFDRYYVNMVAEYHIKDVREFRHEERHAADPDLRAFSHGVLKIMEMDRDQAQELVPHYGHGRTYGGDTPQ